MQNDPLVYFCKLLHESFKDRFVIFDWATDLERSKQDIINLRDYDISHPPKKFIIHCIEKELNSILNILNPLLKGDWGERIGYERINNTIDIPKDDYLTIRRAIKHTIKELAHIVS